MITGRQRDLLCRAGEGIGLAVLRTIGNGIASLRDGVFQFAILRSVRGDVDDKVSQLGYIIIRSEEPCQQ